ncbi:MAG: 50S ribosomal protein L10 [Candidatus Lokiarchaeota archaeon]|nr:50S ribosomal protein L10 [Candidatus Lokiarchaeota archaeon]
MIGKKHIPQWKLDEVDYLIELFNQYKNIMVLKVGNLNDKQVQGIRKFIRGKAIIKMSKKNLQIRAIERFKNESKKENLDDLVDNIPGQAALCFTDIDVFELKKIFNDNLWMVPVKPDDITPVDVWVPAGDTGLPTGQVISELNMTLRLPTQIQHDTIWIRESTRTHKAGDFVNVKQAAVLKKLGVAPIESVIKIHYAWSDGEIYSADVIYMNLDAFKQDLASAYLAAQHLAIELGVVDKETIKPMIQKAYREALGILFESPVYIEDMRDEYIQKAVSNATILNMLLLGEGIPTPTSDSSSKSPKKEEEEEEEEDEVGIGGLFG